MASNANVGMNLEDLSVKVSIYTPVHFQLASFLFSRLNWIQNDVEANEGEIICI